MSDELIRMAKVRTMMGYLNDWGWEYYPGDSYQEETWLKPGRVQFEGDDALERAYKWQREQGDVK